MCLGGEGEGMWERFNWVWILEGKGKGVLFWVLYEDGDRARDILQWGSDMKMKMWDKLEGRGKSRLFDFG